MTYQDIEKIEEQLPPDGLTGYIFFLLAKNSYDNLTETAIIDQGACLILRGSAPIEERREMFIKIYEGCKHIADQLKINAGYPKLAVTNK